MSLPLIFNFEISFIIIKKLKELSIDIESFNENYTDNFTYHECWSTCESECERLDDNDEEENDLYEEYQSICNYINKDCYGIKREQYYYMNSYQRSRSKDNNEIESIIPIIPVNSIKKYDNKIFGIKFEINQDELFFDYDDATDACSKILLIVTKLNEEINNIKEKIKNYETVKNEFRVQFIINKKILSDTRIYLKKIFEYI
jgi:hypothetical protein